MIVRTAKETLVRLASQFPVVGITDLRQSGKSTLAQNTFPGKRYVTFDDRNLRELASANPSDFINAFPNGAIIDEAQKVPEIFDALKYHVDQSFESFHLSEVYSNLCCAQRTDALQRKYRKGCRYICSNDQFLAVNFGSILYHSFFRAGFE